MKHVAHVTLRDGAVVSVEIDATDRRAAAIAAVHATPGAVRASARPLDAGSYVRDRLAEQMFGFLLSAARGLS